MNNRFMGRPLDGAVVARIGPFVDSDALNAVNVPEQPAEDDLDPLDGALPICRYEAADIKSVARKRLIDTIEEMGRTQGREGQSSLTIREFCSWAREHVLGHYKHVLSGEPTGEADNYVAILRVLEPMFGHIAAKDFGQVELYQLLRHYAEAGCKRSYAATVKRRLIRLFRTASFPQYGELLPRSVSQELSQLEDMGGLRFAPARTRDRGPLTAEQIDGTLRELRDQPATVVRLMLATGMRPTETLRMRAEDIDRRGRVWIYRPEVHKTAHHGKDRLVPLVGEARQIVESLLRQYRTGFLFPGRDPDTHYQRTSLDRNVFRAASRAGVEIWTPGQCRKTAATMIRRDADPDLARALLGHEDLSTTTRHYARLDEMAKAVEAAEMLRDALRELRDDDDRSAAV
ncbi:MAG: tyrosine-type recombinase/integrase [Planctomycetota bacterium]